MLKLLYFVGVANLKQMGCAGFRGSEITLYGETTNSPIESTCERTQPRTKVKTNGYFTTYMQVLNDFAHLVWRLSLVSNFLLESAR